MNSCLNNETNNLIEKAITGDKNAIEKVILSVQDLVFNLSLRMLGTFEDAEDATQDILLKVMTHLSTFRKESAFSTWVFRIAIHYLKSYKKHLFAQAKLHFEFYGDDIQNAKLDNLPDKSQNVERNVLSEELKHACTNVMLQCLDAEQRCIFILGTMFHINSKVASEILGISSDSYRQKLSRARRKMAEFLKKYCGEYGLGKCHCKDRIDYAIISKRLNPKEMNYTKAKEISLNNMMDVTNAMEHLDGYSHELSFYKMYNSPDSMKKCISELLESTYMETIKNS